MSDKPCGPREWLPYKLMKIVQTQHHVAIQASGEATTVRILDSRLDGASRLPELWNAVWSAIRAEGPTYLTLDLSAVQFLTSAGLARMLALRKALLEHNGQLTLAGLCPAVRAVMLTTRLDRLFTIIEEGQSQNQPRAGASRDAPAGR